MMTNAIGYVKAVFPASGAVRASVFHCFPYSDRPSLDKAYVAAYNCASRGGGHVAVYKPGGGRLDAPYHLMEAVGEGIGEWDPTEEEN